MAEFDKNHTKQIIRTILLYVVNGLCLGFVIWQTISCTTKYIDKPQVTVVSLKEKPELPSSPAISICPIFGGFEDGNMYNTSYLEDICGISIDKYLYHGKWAENNDDCSDPKKLIESIVYKHENVIGLASFDDFGGNTEYNGTNIGDYETWYYSDNSDYGRCITLLTNNKTKSVTMELFVNSTILIHTPGIWKQTQHKDIELGYSYHIYLDCENHQLLDVDYRGVQCKKEKYYQKDLCTTKKIEKELIDKVGCTTPFGHDKSQICRQEDDASKASDIYYHEISLESNCSNPCSLFSLAISNEEKQSSTNATYLSIVFPKTIKVYDRSYTYSSLSLLAEIGGYVGLFLGISINQVINLLEYLVTKLEWIFRKLGF